MLGMTEYQIKSLINQECFGIPSLFSSIPEQDALQPRDILRKIASAVAKAISNNNQAIEQNLRSKGISV